MYNDHLAGRHILIVEDHFMLLRMMQEILLELGCSSISSASTVEEALLLIREESFDAAALDVNLNGIMSYPVADALIESNTPVLLVTAYGNSEMLEAYGSLPVLKKPYRLAQAVEAFERLLPSEASALH